LFCPSPRFSYRPDLSVGLSFHERDFAPHVTVAVAIAFVDWAMEQYSFLKSEHPLLASDFPVSLFIWDTFYIVSHGAALFHREL
jgi:hypothetical protein